MRTRTACIILALALSITIGSSAAFGGKATVLSDSELDKVYAKGLSFDLDISFRNLNDLINSIPANIQTPQPSATSPLGILPVGNASNNVVVVNDLAQQYLSAFVNVNAAGSIVPVMINLVININSQVQNISNANNLELKNFYRVNIR